MTDEMIKAVNAKLAATRKELEAMGLECSMLWRSPNGAKDAVAYLLVDPLQPARGANSWRAVFATKFPDIHPVLDSNDDRGR